jgi:hypothetical protein
MPRPLTSRVLGCGLVTATLLLLAVPGAVGASRRGIHGRTSQHLSISFSISGHALRRLDFRIDDRCPSGHVWRIHDFDFPPIQIRHSRFDGRFRSLDGRATAEVRGRLLRHRVVGTLSDRTLISQEHRYCHGTARFSLRR